MWTRFMDMHSGGGLKEGSFSLIFIEASREIAELIFYNRFGHDPNRVSCTCCGEDYSISTESTLEAATGYDRNLRHASTGSYSASLRVGDNTYQSRYLEPDEDIPTDWTCSAHYSRDGKPTGSTLDEFLLSEKDSVLIVYAEEILAEEKEGQVHRSGYVWVE